MPAKFPVRGLLIVFAVLTALALGFALGFFQRESPPPSPPPEQPRLHPSLETLAKLKRATVYLEVENAAGYVTGTGTAWFGLEPNWLITNAHVLGLKSLTTPPPAKITVYLYPGQTGQQVELPHKQLKVVAVDRDRDLAIVEVLNPPVPLPEPLPIRPSASLTELDHLCVLGFPGGRRLAEKSRRSDPPQVSVTASTVAALRRDALDNLFSVQVQGGVLHGTSGGPICDCEGNVVAVAVRVDLDHENRLTGIGYGVPTEYVIGLAEGRVAWVKARQKYTKDANVAVPVTVQCHDPRGRLREVGVIAWIGEENTPPRAAGPNRTAATTTDTHEQELVLPYDPKTQTANGELTFPPLPPGRAYWVQPWYGNARVSRHYLAAVKLDSGGPAVIRKTLALKANFAFETKRTFTLNRTVTLTEADGDEYHTWPQKLQYETEFRGSEDVTKPRDAEPWIHFERVLRLESAKSKRLRNGVADALLPANAELFRRSASGYTAYASHTAFGDAPRTRAMSLDQPFVPFGLPLVSGLQSVAIPLQNKELSAPSWWQPTRELTWSLPTQGFDTGPPLAPVVPETTLRETLTLTYTGVREHGPHPVAIIGLTGTMLAPFQRVPVAVTGEISGEIAVDIQTGEVISASLKRSFDLNFGAGGPKRPWSGTEELSFQRTIAE